MKNQKKNRKKKKSNNQKTVSEGRSSATSDFSSSTESDSAFSSTQLEDAMEMVTLNCDSGIDVDSDPGADGSLVAHQMVGNKEEQLSKKKKNKKQKRNNERNTNRRVSESDLMFEIDL